MECSRKLRRFQQGADAVARQLSEAAVWASALRLCFYHWRDKVAASQCALLQGVCVPERGNLCNVEAWRWRVRRKHDIDRLMSCIGDLQDCARAMQLQQLGLLAFRGRSGSTGDRQCGASGELKSVISAAKGAGCFKTGMFVLPSSLEGTVTIMRRREEACFCRVCLLQWCRVVAERLDDVALERSKNLSSNGVQARLARAEALARQAATRAGAAAEAVDCLERRAVVAAAAMPRSATALVRSGCISAPVAKPGVGSGIGGESGSPVGGGDDSTVHGFTVMQQAAAWRHGVHAMQPSPRTSTSVTAPCGGIGGKERSGLRVTLPSRRVCVEAPRTERPRLDLSPKPWRSAKPVASPVGGNSRRSAGAGEGGSGGSMGIAKPRTVTAAAAISQALWRSSSPSPSRPMNTSVPASALLGTVQSLGPPGSTRSCPFVGLQGPQTASPASVASVTSVASCAALSTPLLVGGGAGAGSGTIRPNSPSSPRPVSLASGSAFACRGATRVKKL